MFLQRKLAEESVMDGRIVVMAVVAAYIACLGLVNFLAPNLDIFRKVGVPPIVPIFADLRAILAGFESTRMGYDVLYSMPSEVYGRESLAYPRIWMALAFTGLDLGHAILVGTLFAAGFYLATLLIIGRLNRYEAAFYVLILCSPPALFLVERANVDIMMYVLLLVILKLVSSPSPVVRCLGYGSILVPSALKLLPIFSLGVILKEKRAARATGCFTLVAAAFLAYCVAIREEIKVFGSVYGYMKWYSFGAKIFPQEIADLVTSLIKGGPMDIRARLRILAEIWVVLGFSILAVRFSWHLGGRFRQWLAADVMIDQAVGNSPVTARLLDMFRIGGFLYIGTFLLVIAFDYKLIFLIFAMPQMLYWIKHDRKLGPASSLALAGILITFYASAFIAGTLVDEAINWLLLGYFLYAVLATAPRWIKAPMHRELSAILKRHSTQLDPSKGR